uniref:NB-ARC domain containing protein n=1 Tax=Oryza sativa subsp. japonica TaxID=39947 RepID=Q2QW61_ORYSJ|nr:NB-ARC domain containing protein [Oryza sativa Japonica Group]
MASAVLVFAGRSVATPAISFFVNKAFSYLNKYHKSEGLGDMKKRLKMNIPKIQSVIDVADPDYIKERSEDLDTWLWQLRDAVEKAEDAIDELEYYELKEKQKDLKDSHLGSSFAKMNHKFFQSVKHVKMLGKTSDSPLKRLKKAMEDLDEAAKGVENFLTVVDQITRPNLNIPQRHHSISRYRETGRMLTADRVFGRENEKERIVGWLTSTSSEENEVVMNNNPVPIMSIVGHGGIGKTTLAQLIAKENRIKEHFKTVIWVSVSTNFNAETLISKIIQSVTLSKPSFDTYDALQEHLARTLETIKYLLILDDVWEDKEISEWEKLFASLRTGVYGRKILLTTRMQSVADLASAIPKNLKNYKKLEKKLQETKRLGYFDGGMEDIMKVLKVCFRYCSIFPQDHEFKKEELVQMWIASGLISQTTGECARIFDANGSKKVKRTVRHLSVVGINSFPADIIKSFSRFKNLRTIVFEDCHDIQDNTMLCAQP